MFYLRLFLRLTNQTNWMNTHALGVPLNSPSLSNPKIKCSKSFEVVPWRILGSRPKTESTREANDYKLKKGDETNPSPKH